MFIDMKIGTHRLRYIAIYVPHSGYTVADFHKCLDSLKIVIADGNKDKFQCIIGGDINTQLGTGFRSEAFKAMMGEFNLSAANETEDTDMDSEWTFRSSMGRYRKLDYIIYDRRLLCTRSGPLDELDMGSDHRSVLAVFQLKSAGRIVKRTKISHKQVDWEGFANNFKHFKNEEISSLDDLEASMIKAAHSAKIPRVSTINDTGATLLRLRKLKRQT